MARRGRYDPTQSSSSNDALILWIELETFRAVIQIPIEC